MNIYPNSLQVKFRMKPDKGYIQIYTGNGKGKTTAAIGQAIRALGAGFKVLLVQFMKSYPYSELPILEKFHPQLIVKRYGNDDFVLKKTPPEKTLINEMQQGLEAARQSMCSGNFDMIILDEVLVSIYFKLYKTGEVVRFVKQKPDSVELILTGRYCPDELIQMADLVTEMKEVHHYYNQGILARRGIEF